MADTIKRIYELQNIGKGIISSLTEDNLLLLFRSDIEPDIPGLQDVIDVQQSITNTTNITVSPTGRFGVESTGNDGGGFSVQSDLGISSIFPTASFGIEDGSGFNIRSLEFFKDRTQFLDSTFNKGIIYAGNYESNFTAKSLVTKQYVDDKFPGQKIITYPADFTGINYTLLSSDHNKLIIVKNGATDVTVTIPTGLTSEQFTAFIRQGTGEVAFTTSGTTINSFDGLRINGQYQQVGLDREASTTTFYLTGNTKV